MIPEFFTLLSEWSSLDSWIVFTAALAAMACALPGNYLVLRRQSMMGDALSHTVLPGIVVAFLFAHWLKTSGWISSDTYDATRHAAMFTGAIVIGIMSALLSEWIQKLGHVEASAALGVVFTTLFAVGLLLIRVAADSVHIDPDCVLYGTIETVVMDTYGTTDIPQAAVINAAVLLVNGLLVIVFYKELRVSAFDPNLATAVGINAQWMHYALMAMTAATLVAAFESVGSILVIAMLIVPAATAYLLTDRLGLMIGLSLLVAALSALLGHVMAITLPPLVFGRLGFDTVRDASTAGMMAAACGCLFVTAMLCGPRYGVLSKLVHQGLLSLRIVREDVLGFLYRLEELAKSDAQPASPPPIDQVLGTDPLMTMLAIRGLTREGKIVAAPTGFALTASGRESARSLVRSHRLWESYMALHFPLPDDHLHESAARVEHYIDPIIRRKLEAELDKPELDPHGRVIPTERGDSG